MTAATARTPRKSAAAVLRTARKPAAAVRTSRTRPRPLRVAALLAVLLGAAAAGCGTEADGKTAVGAQESGPRWSEPSAYSYTLESSEGERSLIGAFRVTVRDGKVAKATGLDESGKRVVEQSLTEVPTIGGLLEEWEQAREDDADRAEVAYAPDGHPVRISLDWEEHADDDEALYVISDYKPTAD